jgi:hypothetical protein
MAFWAGPYRTYLPFGPILFERNSLPGRSFLNEMAFQAGPFRMYWPFGSVLFERSGPLGPFDFRPSELFGHLIFGLNVPDPFFGDTDDKVTQSFHPYRKKEK